MALYCVFVVSAYIRELGYRATAAPDPAAPSLAAIAGLGRLKRAGQAGHEEARHEGHVGDVIRTDLPLAPTARRPPVPYVITELCTRGRCLRRRLPGRLHPHTTPEAGAVLHRPEICIECEQCKIVCPVEAISWTSSCRPSTSPRPTSTPPFFRQNKEVVAQVGLDEATVMAEARAALRRREGLLRSRSSWSTAPALPSSSPAWTALRRPPPSWRSTRPTPHPVPRPDRPARPRRPTPRLPQPGHLERGEDHERHGRRGHRRRLAVRGAIAVDGGKTAEQNVLCCQAGWRRWAAGH